MGVSHCKYSPPWTCLLHDLQKSKAEWAMEHEDIIRYYNAERGDDRLHLDNKLRGKHDAGPGKDRNSIQLLST